MFIGVSSWGATFVWNGGAADANWSTGSNWVGGIAPTNNGTASVVLAGTNQLSPNVDTAWSISSLSFTNTAGAFVLAGNSLTIGSGGITNNTANPQVINNSISLGANQTWYANSNSLTVAGNINNAGYLLMVSGGFNSTISGILSGSGGLTKSGAGTDFLSGTNTYTGVTTVSAGVLNLQNSSALGGGSGGTTVASGAALQLQGGISVAGESLTISGTGIASTGAIRNISGSNVWSGTITLAAASTIESDSGTLDLEANISNSTFTTTFTNNAAILLNGVLGGGTGGLTQNGTGLLSLGGANTYTGATTVNGGTVRFSASGSASSTSAVTVAAAGILNLNGFNESPLSLAGAGSVTLGGGTLTVNNTAAATFSGVMSGAGNLVEAGTGTYTLSGVNTYTGGTTINAGAISIAAAAGLGNATNTLTLNGGTLTTSATLTLAQSITLDSNNGIINAGGTTLTLSGTISGPGALTKVGTKTLALTGANTYLGGTTNAAGTITLDGDAGLGSSGSALTFSNSATLTTTASFSSTRNIAVNAGTATVNTGTGFTNTFNGVISGAGALTKSGTGVLLLAGTNTYTNTTTISAGTLRMGCSGAISSLSPVVITKSTAIFDLNNFSQTIGSLASTAAGKVTLSNAFLTAGGNNLSTTNSCVISGGGGFTMAGTGTLIFTGANTYTNTTTVAAGTLQLGANSRIASTSPLVVSNGAVFNLNNYNQTVASLSGGGSVTLGSGTLTAGNAGSVVFSGSISGTGAFTKVGAGMQTFNGTNTYTGATTVSVGDLQVNGSSTGSAVTMSSGATLSGDGTVGTVAGASGSIISPGSSGPGTLAGGSQTWAAGGNYVWDINNPTGSEGGGSGWDWLNISGTLTINATTASPFNINITSLTAANATGSLTNFDDTATYIWTIASASGGITGFNSAAINLNTSAFQNSLGAGTFAISQSGNNLNLIFTSAPLAAIKDVQSGTLTISGNGTNTVTLGAAVNPTNAFLIFNTSHNSPVPGGSMISGTLASSNSVVFVRATTETSTMNIQWYVVEYSAGVWVQRGQVNQTNTTINVPLSPISAVNQAFVTWSKTPDPAETAFTDCDPVVGQIMSVSNLQFRVSAAPSSVPVISWQVVEFLNPASISVQQGSITNLTGTNLLATATLAAPVNTNSTFLLTGYCTSGSGTNIGARMLRAQLTSATNLTFDRCISGAPDDISEIAWQAVQLNDGSLVQYGSANLTNGVATTNVTIINLNTNRAAAFSSVQPAGGQNTGRSPSTGNVLGVGSATLALTSNSQLTLNRDNTSDQADVGWFVVGFGPGTLLVPATGGTAISADTATNTYTSLTGPVYTEIENGNVGKGTIILNAPAGFIFDTNAPLPTVLITRVGGTGANSLNINGVASGTSVAMTTIKTTNLTFTVTSASSNGVTCSLTWQNLSVRPTAGTPLASGNLVSSGTSVIQGVTTNSTVWGYLDEVVGVASKLAIATAPSSAVTAGATFPQQPVIQVEDQFGNLRAADNTTVITAISSGTDTNSVDGSMTAVGGVAAFSEMSYQIAQTNTITFSAPGLTSKTSGNIVVSAAAASQVNAVTDPSATATAGVIFAQQPVVQVQDAFGNLRVTDNSTTITASIGQGSGDLFGTQTLTAVNGVVTFTNLSYQVAETILIVYTASGLATDNSTVAVGAAAASQLVIQTQPSGTATAGVPFAQQPVVLLEDQYGNLCATNNSAVVTASRDTGSGSGVLQGGVNVTASGGVAAFSNLSHNVATTISVDFNSGGMTGATSSGIAIVPSGVAQLAFATQPGSATVGSVFGVQPVVITQDAYGNNSVAGLAGSLNVVMSLTAGIGPLQGSASFNIGTSAGNGTAAFTNLRLDSAGSGNQLTAGASGLASAVSSSFSVAQGNQTITFGGLSGQTYGNPPFAVNATASSGLPITFTIVSGPATVSSNMVSLTGAGMVTVGASQPGNSNYNAATSVNQSFTVAPAVLTVAANNQTRVFGAANPALTASISGFVNGDTQAGSVTGSPALTTTATTASTVAGGPYPITATNGTLSAANYTFGFTSGLLTVSAASSTNSVASSANPALPGSTVTFTATLAAISPGSGAPTGTVQFEADGSPLGSPATLTNGVASLSTNSLSHGYHTLTALYAGDGNFIGSTNSLTPEQSINTPPTAGNTNYNRSPGLSLKINIAALLAANASDADGDRVTLQSVGAGSQGATIATNGVYIFYLPANNNNDSFTYTVGDGYGGTASGTITVTVVTPGGIIQNITSSGGAVTLNFAGIPGFQYDVLRSSNLVSWASATTMTAPAAGLFIFTETPPMNPCYYRLRQH